MRLEHRQRVLPLLHCEPAREQVGAPADLPDLLEACDRGVQPLSHDLIPVDHLEYEQDPRAGQCHPVRRHPLTLDAEYVLMRIVHQLAVEHRQIIRDKLSVVRTDAVAWIVPLHQRHRIALYLQDTGLPEQILYRFFDPCRLVWRQLLYIFNHISSVNPPAADSSLAGSATPAQCRCAGRKT